MATKETTQTKPKEIQVVVFRLGEEEFAAEITSVLEISRMLPITHLAQAPDFIEGVINLRGKVIAVMNLSRLFATQTSESLSQSGRIVIVEAGNETVGLQVDEVVEILRLPEEKIEPLPELVQGEVKSRYLRGVGKLGERLILLVDLAGVLTPDRLKVIEKAA